MLKWEKTGGGSWVGRADGFEYRTIVNFFDSEVVQQKAELQAKHDARVAKIALANGYVKLADDEIVMPRVMARELIASRCECCEDEGLSDCGDCDIKPIRDKIKEVTP